MAEREVTIKHGLFYYHEPVKRIVAGEEKELLVERLAFNGETVTLTKDADYERGIEFDAFYTDEELKALAPAASPTGATVPEAGEGESARPVSELDDEELVDWLMSTGEFDGQKKPTAADVILAVGDDAELADRALAAEEHASGGSPRKAVAEHVAAVVDDADGDEDDDEDDDE